MSKEKIFILGLIPARGGSKGIPNKNIVDLNGQPLIQYTIQAATNSTLLSQAIVTTDDQTVANIAQNVGADVPFLRPAELATDRSGALGVIEHAIEYFKSQQQTIDYIVYLQPTSPLRTTDDIDQAIDIMTNSKADSLVSTMDVPHQFGFESLMVEEAHSESKFVSHAVSKENNFRRQEKRQYVARNGPAILITTPNTIKKYGSLYGEKIVSYKMPANRSADIDDLDDLEYISWLMQKRSN